MKRPRPSFITTPLHRRPPHPISATRSPTAAMRPVPGFRALPPFDALLLDQFGVIHDGRTPYPRALSAIRRLHSAGTKILILSNSSREAHHARRKLAAMGVCTDAIHAVITSGELALQAVSDAMRHAPASRVLHINWGETRGTISSERHGIRQFPVMKSVPEGLLPDPADVDLIVAHGTDGIMTSATSLQPLSIDILTRLCREVARVRPDVPFYCANPDFVTVDGGALRIMPGQLAREFERAGGRNVIRLGKPGRSVYEKAREILGGASVLAVGDSLAHDVLGAAEAGVESMYIAGGINANKFGIQPSDGFKDEDCAWDWNEGAFETLKKDDAPELGERNPTYVCPFFRW